MNTCEHYRLQISQLLDGELPEAQQQTLRAHLHTCPDCQRVYEDFLTLQAAVRGTAAEPPSRCAMSQFRQRVPRSRCRRAGHRIPNRNQKSARTGVSLPCCRSRSWRHASR